MIKKSRRYFTACFLAVTLLIPVWAEPFSLTSAAANAPADTSFLLSFDMRDRATLPSLLESIDRQGASLTSAIAICEGMSLKLPQTLQWRIVLLKWTRGLLQQGLLSDLSPHLAPCGSLAVRLGPKDRLEWVLAIKTQDAQKAKVQFEKLSQIQIPGLTSAGECKRNLRNLQTALEMYASDNMGKYPAKLESVTPTYLSRIPICLSGQRETYSGGYQLLKDGNFRLACSGNHHQLGEGIPFITSSGEEQPPRSADRVTKALASQVVGSSVMYQLPSELDSFGWISDSNCWAMNSEWVYCANDAALLRQALVPVAAGLANQAWFSQVAAEVPADSLSVAFAPGALNSLGWPSATAVSFDPSRSEMVGYLPQQPVALTPVSQNPTARYIPIGCDGWICGDWRPMASGQATVWKSAAWSETLAGPYSWGAYLGKDLPPRFRFRDELLQAQDCVENQETLAGWLAVYQGKMGRLPKQLKELVPSCTSAIAPCPTSKRPPKFQAFGGGKFTLACEGHAHASIGLGPNQPFTDQDGAHFQEPPGPPLHQIWVAQVRQVSGVPGLMRSLLGPDAGQQTVGSIQLHSTQKGRVCWGLLDQANPPLLLVAEGERASEGLQEALRAGASEPLSIVSSEQFKLASQGQPGLFQCESLRQRELFGFLNSTRWVELWRRIKSGNIRMEKVLEDNDLQTLLGAVSQGWLWDLLGPESFEGGTTIQSTSGGYLWRRRGGIPLPVLWRALEGNSQLPRVWSSILLGRPSEAELASDSTEVCCSNLKNLSTAMEMYRADHKKFPASLRLLVPQYLRKLPICPTNPKNSYSEGASLGRQDFVLSCKAHRVRYSNTAGLIKDR